jgi:hypothetical protein
MNLVRFSNRSSDTCALCRASEARAEAAFFQTNRMVSVTMTMIAMKTPRMKLSRFSMGPSASERDILRTRIHGTCATSRDTIRTRSPL